MISYILFITFSCPDCPTLYQIKDTKKFFEDFSSIEEWSLSVDYEDYVEELEFNGVLDLPGKVAYHVVED